MPRELALSVNIGGRLVESFRACMEQARAGLAGIRREAQNQNAAAAAATAATAGLARASSQAGQAAAGLADTAASLRQAGAAASGAAGQTEKLRRNEEALSRAMERNNALAERRSRIYADMAKLSLQSAALLAPAGAAVSAAAVKQDTIRDIAITGGMDEADENALSAAVRQISQQSNQLQTEVLNGMKVLVAGGVQSREELVGFGAELSRVATATRASMDDLGATTLALRDNLGITAKDIGASFNILASAGKAGLVELKDAVAVGEPASLTDSDSNSVDWLLYEPAAVAMRSFLRRNAWRMAKFLPQMAPTLAAMGISGQEAVAEMAAALQIARRGAGTNDEAATNMRNYLQKIFAPDTVKNFADAGIDLKASLLQLQKDGIGPFEGSMMLVMEYMRTKSPAAAAEFQKAMQVKDDAERAQALARISEAYALSDLFRDMQAMNFLRPMVMQMEDYRKIKADSLGAAEQDVVGQDFARRMQSPVEQWKAMRVEAERLTESLGTALLPSALAFGQTLLPIVRSLTQWIERNQELVVTLAKGAAILLGFRAGLLALRLGFSLFVSPLASAGARLLAFRAMTAAGIAPVQALFRLFGMSPRMATLLSGGLGRVGTLFRGLGGAALSFGRTLAGPLATGFSLAGKAALVLGRALLLNPVGLLVTGIGVAAIAIYKNWDRIKSAFSAGWNWLRSMGPKLLKQGLDLAANILPGAAAVKYIYQNWDAIKAAMSRGIDWLRSLPAQFLQMGKNLAAGLVNGIKSGISAAGDAIAGMAEGIKNTFKGWLGISSPSRVFSEYGLNVAQGAAQGMLSGEDAVAGASAGLASATAKGWQPPSLNRPELNRPKLSPLGQALAPGVATQEATHGDSSWLTRQSDNVIAVAIRKLAMRANGYRQAQQVELARPRAFSLPEAVQAVRLQRPDLSPLAAVPQQVELARPRALALPEAVQAVRLNRPNLPPLAVAPQQVELALPGALALPEAVQAVRLNRPELPPLAVAPQQVELARPRAFSLPEAVQAVRLNRPELPPLPVVSQSVALQRPDLSPLGQALQAPHMRQPFEHAEPNWTPPKLLTDANGPGRIGAAMRGGQAGQSGGMNITFSPSVTIQGNADAQKVQEGLGLTLEDLKRMLARIAHERDRRAYV